MDRSKNVSTYPCHCKHLANIQVVLLLPVYTLFFNSTTYMIPKHQKLYRPVSFLCLRHASSATRHILRGWPYSPNYIRLQKIFQMIDFHRKNKGCPCCLLGQEDNPHYVVEDGYFDLLQTVPCSPKCSINDYYPKITMRVVYVNLAEISKKLI